MRKFVLDKKLSAKVIFLLINLLFSGIIAQEKFTDKLFPRSNDWSVNCRIYSVNDDHVLVLFPNKDKPSEISRSSIRKIEYSDKRQVFFNEKGEIEAEFTLPVPAKIAKVRSLGILSLYDGKEVVMNGIDFTLPSDSLELYHFQKGIEFIENMILDNNISLQYDVVKRDEFGRTMAYVILANGQMLNIELIKKGFGKVDRGRPLIFLNDFIAAEEYARANKVGIWEKIR